MLTTLLRTQAVDARTVETSAQALLAVQAERFDLYSLETRLPDLNGFELCRKIREVEPYVPILFFSGADYEADRKLGIAAGANGYVIKPDIHCLLRAIDYLLSSFAPTVPMPVEVNVPGLSGLDLPQRLRGATANSGERYFSQRAVFRENRYRNHNQHENYHTGKTH